MQKFLDVQRVSRTKENAAIKEKRNWETIKRISLREWIRRDLSWSKIENDNVIGYGTARLSDEST